MRRAVVLAGILFALGGPSALAQSGTAPGAPGAEALWTQADKDGFGTATSTTEQGLAHARRRRADRGLLPRPRHPGRARPAVHRLRRPQLRGARDRRHDAPHGAARPPQPHLPPGQHGPRGPLPHLQDLRRGPVAQRAAGRRALRVAHPPAAAALCPARPCAVQRRRRRLRLGGRLVAAGRGRRRGRRAGRAPALHTGLQRLPRHQRRLGGPAHGLPDGRELRVGARRQRRPDRADEPHRSAPPSHDDARAGLRRPSARAPWAPRATRWSAASGAWRPATCTAGTGYLRSLRPAPAQRPRPPHHLRRVGDDARRARGQDVPRRLRRLAVDAVGVGPGTGEPLRRLPPRVVARPLPDRHRAAGGRRPRRRAAGARLPVRAPAEARRLVPAELDRRRHGGLGERCRWTRSRCRSCSPGSSSATTPTTHYEGQASGRVRGRQRPVLAPGALGEPGRLLAGHDRRGDRRPRLRRRPRAPQRRHGPRGQVGGEGRRVGGEGRGAGRPPRTARTRTIPTTCG